MPRHPTHDYRSICIYHITISKAPSVPYFSTVTGSPQSPDLIYSPLGRIVETNILTISDLNRAIERYQYVIMPDHIHLLLHVTEYLDKPIGVYISKFKIRILQMARDRGIWTESVFSPDFHDRFLRPFHSLDVIYEYIRQNPYRLLIRKAYPDFFRRVNNIFYYENMQWQAYGNLQLLANPFKDAVVCHRADAGTLKEERLIKNWMHTASNGGVLVSPFIAHKEKEIRDKAEEKNGKIILISNIAFGERYKPAAHDFQQCESGSLLIIAPVKDLPESRRTFLFLNKLAEDISFGRIKIRGLS